MVYLNVIYFLIITYLAITYLQKRFRVLANPCVANGKIAVDGPELFWILTFSTGLLAFSADVGLDLMAIRLLVLEILCLCAINMTRNKVVLTPALIVYFVFVAWMVIGLFYGPNGSFMYGIRTILKYMYAPLVALCASSIVKDFEVFMKAATFARVTALVSFIVGSTFLRHLVPGAFWCGTALAINYISIMTLSLVLFFEGDSKDKKKNLAFSIFFIIPCFIWVFRTSIMGSLVAIMTVSFIKWRIKSLPIIAAVLIAGVLAVFFIPSLNEKMFREENAVTLEQFQESGVSMDNIDSNGRQGMWEYCEEHFYKGHELTGSGTGNLQYSFYTSLHKIFNGIKIIHSDFFQQKCDNGLIGLVLYGAASFLIFLHCFFTYHSTRDPRIRIPALVAGAAIIGVYVTHYSDNTVNYSMATLSMPYGFYGMMLGIKSKLKR